MRISWFEHWFSFIWQWVKTAIQIGIYARILVYAPLLKIVLGNVNLVLFTCLPSASYLLIIRMDLSRIASGKPHFINIKYTLLCAIKQLCISCHWNIEGMCQSTHLPCQLDGLSNKWLYHSECSVWWQEDLGISVQSTNNILQIKLNSH